MKNKQLQNPTLLNKKQMCERINEILTVKFWEPSRPMIVFDTQKSELVWMQNGLHFLNKKNKIGNKEVAVRLTTVFSANINKPFGKHRCFYIYIYIQTLLAIPTLAPSILSRLLCVHACMHVRGVCLSLCITCVNIDEFQMWTISAWPVSYKFVYIQSTLCLRIELDNMELTGQMLVLPLSAPNSRSGELLTQQYLFNNVK